MLEKNLSKGEVLVAQCARFGDLVQTGRLVKSLQRENLVHLAIDASLESLASLLYPDAIIHPLFIHGELSPEKLAHNLKIFGELRENTFSAVYNCNLSPLTNVICRIFELEKVYGYRPCALPGGGIERSPWVRFVFRLAKKRVLSPLNLVDFWAYFMPAPIEPATVNPLPQAGGKGIGIVLAGREARRSLSIPTLANLINVINKVYHKPPFFLLGSKSEVDISRKLTHEVPDARILNLAGKTSWPQLVDALRGLDLLVTPDTGVMHLAAFLGVPVMAFFMSSAWMHETGPYGKNHIVWQSAPPCAPCIETAVCRDGEICRNVYESPEFVRLFTQFLLNPEKSLEFPKDLQLWRTDYDEIGEKALLIRGSDPLHTPRETARDFMIRFLGHQGTAFDNFPNDWINFCGKLLCPDDEWMLPPERYC